MQPSYRPFIMGGIVGIVALTWVVHNVHPAKDASPMTAGPVSRQSSEQVFSEQASSDKQGVVDDVTVLKREVALLKADLDIVRRQIKEQAAHAPAGSDVAASSVATDPAFPSEEAGVADSLEAETIAAEEEKREVEERMQALESSLQNEPLDSDWSPQAREQITEVFASKELAETSLEHIECRSTLCRVEVEHDDLRKRREFELWFPFKVAEILPRIAMRYVENDNGSSGTIIYLAREGHRLPDQPTGIR
ncbi:MAG: hypothetical protein ACREV3_05505 [Gammaproteobacteria bacterium]